MDGRIERLLEQMGLKQEPFRSGWAEFFKEMPDRYAFEDLYRPRLNLNEGLGIMVDLIAPNVVNWRNTFQPSENNYSWGTYDASNTYTWSDNSGPELSYFDTKLPEPKAFNYTVQGY